MDAFARRVGFTPRRLPDLADTRRRGRPAPTTGDRARPRTRRSGSTGRGCCPPLTLYLHLSADDLATGQGGVVRWEGEGPVTHAFVHEHLRPLHRYVIKPVIDLAHQAPVDAYELPDRLREAVRLLAAGRRVPVRRRSQPRARRRPHRALRPGTRRRPRAAVVHPAGATSARWAASTTGSRPTGTGPCASRSRASTCGATRTARSTSRTTPAPTRSPGGTPRQRHRVRPRARGLPHRHVIEADFGQGS